MKVLENLSDKQPWWFEMLVKDWSIDTSRISSTPYLWSQIIEEKNLWESQLLKGEINGSKTSTKSSSQEWEMLKFHYQNDLSSDLQKIIKELKQNWHWSEPSSW